MTVVRGVLAAAAAALLSLGGAGAAVADPGPHEVVLTNADNGHVVSVAPGETVVVRLTGMVDRSMVWAWSAPSATAPRVLDRTTDATTPDGDATATFRASAPGASDIGAYRHCVPGPGVMCARIAIPWKATVTVTIG